MKVLGDFKVQIAAGGLLGDQVSQENPWAPLPSADVGMLTSFCPISPSFKLRPKNQGPEVSSAATGSGTKLRQV